MKETGIANVKLMKKKQKTKQINTSQNRAKENNEIFVKREPLVYNRARRAVHTHTHKKC